jgi:hypothetical protein
MLAQDQRPYRELSQAEYDCFGGVIDELAAERTRGLDPSTEDYATARARAESLVRLPTYHWHDKSVYVYWSDGGVYLLRPPAVARAREKLRQFLDQACVKYAPARAGVSGKANAGAGKN